MVVYYIIGGILLAMAVFLVVAVIMQNGKSHNLSGTIAGGAETFFGKTKGKAMDRLLARWTTIIAIVFVILVLILFIVQEDAFDSDDAFESLSTSSSATTTTTSSATTTTAANAMVDAPAKLLMADGQSLVL